MTAVRREGGGAVVRRPAGDLLPVRADPEQPLSPGLHRRVSRLAEYGRPDLDLDGTSVAESAEAVRVLASFEAMCLATIPQGDDVDQAALDRGQALISAWMEAVALGVVNAPDKPLRALRVAMVVDTSGDLPVTCWTRETRAGFARRGAGAEFWPSDSEVDRFLRPIGNRLLAKRDALRAVRDAAPPPDPPAPLTDAEREAILVKFRADMRAGMGQQAADAVLRPRPSHLPKAEMRKRRAASREAMGLPPLDLPPVKGDGG